jgi:hypothetical protein
MIPKRTKAVLSGIVAVLTLIYCGKMGYDLGQWLKLLD